MALIMPQVLTGLWPKNTSTYEAVIWLDAFGNGADRKYIFLSMGPVLPQSSEQTSGGVVLLLRLLLRMKVLSFGIGIKIIQTM